MQDSVVSTLGHDSRRRIYEHLLLLPGDHFRSIVRSLHLAVGEARHHLDVLLRKRLIRVEKTIARSRYYVEGRRPEAERNEVFMKHWAYRALRERVFLAVRTRGEAGPTEVGAALGVSRQLAAYHLVRLADAGLIRRTDGRYRVP